LSWLSNSTNPMSAQGPDNHMRCSR